MPRPYNIYDTIVIHTNAFNGGSFLIGKEHVYPIAPSARVWVLSLDDKRGIVVPLSDFDMTTLTMWCLNGNEEYIRTWNSRHTNYGSLKCIGTWIDEGNVYIDVSTIIGKDDMSRESVLELARANNQRTVWDNENQVAIETGLVSV